MKTVILGAGYIGKALLEFWQGSGKELIATTTSEERLAEIEELAIGVVIEAENKKSLAAILKNTSLLVVTLAAKSSDLYEQTYLESARAIRDILKKESSIEQVIYTSSTSVYGDCKGEWVSEEAKTYPNTQSQIILHETEEIYLNELPKGVLATVLRLGGTYGPDREHEARAKRLAGTTVSGSGDSYCNWVHQEDVVRAIDWAYRKKLHGIYNLCAEDHPTKKELYGSIIRSQNLPPINWDSSSHGPHSGNKRVVSNKIQQTGFEFLHGCKGPLEWVR